jgi:hypothetical protein
LTFVQFGEVLFAQAPFDLGIVGQGAGAGTGSIDKDAVEDGFEGERTFGVEKYERNSQIAHADQTVHVNVAGNGEDAGFEGLGGLVTGSGAEIQMAQAGFQIEQRNHGLGADVLNSERRG